MWRLNQFLTSFRINRAINKQTKGGVTDQSSTYHYQLDSFIRKSDVRKWDCAPDVSIGGSSKGIIQFSEQDQAVTMLGQLVSKSNVQLESSPFVSFDYSFIRELSLSEFNVLRLQLRTDTQIYKLRLAVTSDFNYGGHYANAYIVDTSQDWNTYEIPFGNMQIEEQKQKTNLAEHMTSLKLHSISLMKEGTNNEKFAIQIKSIELGQQVLRQDYTSPIMYKLNAFQSGIIDVGNAKYRQSEKVRQAEVKSSQYVNNFH